MYVAPILWINMLVIFEITLLSKNVIAVCVSMYVCMECVPLITQLSTCICKSFHMYIPTYILNRLFTKKYVCIYILMQYVVLTPPLKNFPSSRRNTVPYGIGSSVEYTCIHTHAGKCKHIAT